MGTNNGILTGMYYNWIAVIIILLVLGGAISWYKYKNKKNKYVSIKFEDYNTNYNGFKQDLES